MHSTCNKEITHVDHADIVCFDTKEIQKLYVSFLRLILKMDI